MRKPCAPARPRGPAPPESSNQMRSPGHVGVRHVFPPETPGCERVRERTPAEARKSVRLDHGVVAKVGEEPAGGRARRQAIPASAVGDDEVLDPVGLAPTRGARGGTDRRGRCHRPARAGRATRAVGTPQLPTASSYRARGSRRGSANPGSPCGRCHSAGSRGDRGRTPARRDRSCGARRRRRTRRVGVVHRDGEHSRRHRRRRRPAR